jgi:hypothetical protein
MVFYLNKYLKHNNMTTYLGLETVKEKIAELETALFYDLGDSVLKIPVSVIKVLLVDELGQIWFAIPFHFHYQQDPNRSFQSKLHFFRKGKGFYLNITGKAYFLIDPEEVNNAFSISDELKKKVQAKELALLKVRIRTADCFERKRPSVKKDYKNILYQFFGSFYADSQSNYFNYRTLHLDH